VTERLGSQTGTQESLPKPFAEVVFRACYTHVLVPSPKIAAVGASSHPPTCWSPVNDHRWIADAHRGLFYVVDDFGPTYGGYYAPFGIDPGLAELDAAFDTGCGGASQRLLRHDGRDPVLSLGHRGRARCRAQRPASVLVERSAAPPAITARQREMNDRGRCSRGERDVARS
jgi:hypothetical protein